MNAENHSHSSASASGNSRPASTIRLSSPGAMVHALPLILGIEHLSDDLVLLATRGRANVLTARIDLNALSERMVWAAVQHALIKADAERVHVLVYPEAPVTGQVLASLHEDLGHLATGTPRG